MATATATATKANPWDIKVGGPGGGDYECCPPGTHIATIVGLFHVGHQVEQSQEKGQVEVNRLILVLELSKRKKDGHPFVLPARYTMSMHKKANLFRDATTILGRRLQEGDRFNPLELSGKPVMVSVTNTANGDKSYHNVAAISAFPEGFPTPTPTHDEIAWSVLTGDPFPDDADWLPYVYGRSIEDMAGSSPESRRRSDAAAPADDPADGPPF
jgi:hypothetical protein